MKPNGCELEKGRLYVFVTWFISQIKAAEIHFFWKRRKMYQMSKPENEDMSRR
jgi:hypothetical protein